MYISEIQQRLMNAVGVCGNYNGVLALAVENGANTKEMKDPYHLALWFEGAPASVKHKLLDLFDIEGIIEHGLRICDDCGKFFTEGYILDDCSHYSCSRGCAMRYYGSGKELDKMLNDYPDENFWTEWDQEL